MKKMLIAVVLVVLAAVMPAAAQDVLIPEGAVLIEGSYIVLLKADELAQSGVSVPLLAVDMAARYGGTLTQVYEGTVQGFAISLKEEAARKLAADKRVELVEQDQWMFASVTQSPATWGIDRIDQRALPRNNAYNYNTTASNVRAFIIDTGILTGHSQFGGRASVGFDAFGGNGQDCNGHGTHVAGTVGSATYGVAKGVRLIAVRVLSCSGSGSNSGVIAGVNFAGNSSAGPRVANMSLGGGASGALDTAVNNAINRGVTFAVAAGNSHANACNTSPARAPAAITVGSTTSSDSRSSFSNFGSCLDIFAPGSSITSTWIGGSTRTISGTSMASPHVAGVAALYLATHTGASPSAVRTAMVNAATTGRVTNAGSGSPNRLLYSLIPQ
jgi:subtilisin family serine protease